VRAKKTAIELDDRGFIESTNCEARRLIVAEPVRAQPRAREFAAPPVGPSFHSHSVRRSSNFSVRSGNPARSHDGIVLHRNRFRIRLARSTNGAKRFESPNGNHDGSHPNR
jgi:hypothetical protein